MSKNTARQNYETFVEWKNWAIAKGIIKIKKKKPIPIDNYLKEFY
jgi:hypothetical protein